MKKESNIKSWKNRRKYRFLSHTYIGFDKQKYEMVPYVLSLSIN